MFVPKSNTESKEMKVTAPPPKHIRAACDALGIPMTVTVEDEAPRVFFEVSARSEEEEEEDTTEEEGWRSKRKSPRTQSRARTSSPTVLETKQHVACDTRL